MRSTYWASLLLVSGGLLAGSPAWAQLGDEGGPAGPGPRVSAPETKSNITFRITGISTTSNLNFGPDAGRAPRVESWLNVSGRFNAPKGGIAVCPWGMEITQALDERERDLAQEATPDRSGNNRDRVSLMQHFYQVGMQGYDAHEGYVSVQDSVRGLKGLPSKFMMIKGYAEAVAGTRVVRTPVDLKAMKDPIELVPGVTFLITEVTNNPKRCVVDFEVRTRRYREGDKGAPGLEPVFIGLVLKDAEGHMQNVLRNGQEVEMRDEYILLDKNQGLSPEMLERIASVEAVVVDGIQSVRFEFEVSNVELAGRD